MISRKNHFKQKLLTDFIFSKDVILIYQHANLSKSNLTFFKNSVKDFTSDFIREYNPITRFTETITNIKEKYTNRTTEAEVNIELRQVNSRLIKLLDNTAIYFRKGETLEEKKNKNGCHLGGFFQGPTILLSFSNQLKFVLSEFCIHKIAFCSKLIEDESLVNKKCLQKGKFVLFEELDQIPLLHYLAAYALWHRKQKKQTKGQTPVHPVLVGAVLFEGSAFLKLPSLRPSVISKSLTLPDINKLVRLYEINLLTKQQNPAQSLIKQLDLGYCLYFLDSF